VLRGRTETGFYNHLSYVRVFEAAVSVNAAFHFRVAQSVLPAE
jgi:hypothetical protein